jgi:hypothetical protein
VATGPDDELFATGTLTGEYNDNLFLSHSNDKSVFQADLTPGLEWDFGKNSLDKGYVAAGNDFQLFSSESNLDTDLPFATFVSAYDDGKTKFDLDANYQLLDQAERDVHLVGTLIKRDSYHVNTLGEVGLTEKTSVSAGLIYDDTSYRTAGYQDWQWVNVPVKYYYAVEPKLDVSAGFTYQNNAIGAPGVDSNEYFYNVGARGDFTPKLTGEFSVGFQEIQFFKGLGTTSGVGADSTFNYAYTPKTVFTLSVKDDYGYSPVGGTSFRDFGVTGGFTSEITDQWKVGGQISYDRYSYLTTSQRDDFYTGQGSLTYVVNTNVSLTGTYRYGQDHSNITADSFTNNVVSLAVTLKY